MSDRSDVDWREMRRRHPAFYRECALVTAALATALVFRAGGAYAASAASADNEQVRVHAELGAEYDNNVHWAAQTGAPDGPPRLGSGLARLVLGLSTADRIGAGQDVAFSILGAAKTFQAAEAHSENVGVVETSGTWRIAVGPRTRWGVNGSYYEAIQAGTAAERELSGVARDFRSLSPTLRLARAVGDSGTIAVAAGHRWFVYKPLRGYDFTAPVFALEYRVGRETADGNADWEVVAAGGAELRRFAGTRLVLQQGCSSSMCAVIRDPAGEQQMDQFFSGSIDVTRTGRFLIGLGYALRWNHSNSYSETLLRHSATMRITLPLPFELYLAARMELVYISYADRALFPSLTAGQSFATIEDENRSTLRTELSRDVAAHLQLIARYSLYLNAVGQGTYQRQTASLSLSLTFE